MTNLAVNIWYILLVIRSGALLALVREYVFQDLLYSHMACELTFAKIVS